MELKKMGKYSESVGIWKHTIGKITNEIKPEEQDNLKFVEIKKDADKAKDEAVLIKGVAKLYYDMVTRTDKSLTAEDQKELKTWISMNINRIVTDLLIKFNWTTQEKLDKMEETQKKKMFP